MLFYFKEHQEELQIKRSCSFHSISLHIYEFYIWGNITLFLSAQLLHSELECSREIPDLYALFKRAVKLELMAERGVKGLG